MRGLQPRGAGGPAVPATPAETTMNTFLRSAAALADEHHMVWVPGDAALAPLIESVRTGTVRVALPPDEALPLFTAEGEKRWVPGWTPTWISPPDGAPVEGGVWLTRDGETEVIWRVQRYDRVAYANCVRAGDFLGRRLAAATPEKLAGENPPLADRKCQARQ